MDVSLIILVYNDGRRASGLVEKIKDHKTFDHIVIVNNCSTDDTYEVISATALTCPTKVTVISTPENGGYAKGNNFGVRYALDHFNSDYIFIANPDTFFTDETSHAMLCALKNHPEYGVAAPIVTQGCNVWRLTGFASVIESLFLIIFNLDRRRLKKRLISCGHTLVAVDVVEGSFFAISRYAYEKTGGFDERTFLYGEEMILSYRLRQAGLKTGVLTKERYDHLHSATIKKLNNNSKARAFHHFRDSFRIFNKYYLHTGPLQDLIFECAYGLAHMERVIYDRIVSLFEKRLN